jgi:hypothetical protein
VAFAAHKKSNTLSGFGLTNVFDGRDRLATTTGPASISCSYDENNQLMRENVGANTTHSAATRTRDH